MADILGKLIYQMQTRDVARDNAMHHDDRTRRNEFVEACADFGENPYVITAQALGKTMAIGLHFGGVGVGETMSILRAHEGTSHLRGLLNSLTISFPAGTSCLRALQIGKNRKDLGTVDSRILGDLERELDRVVQPDRAL
jgi:hypothetical protein